MTTNNKLQATIDYYSQCPTDVNLNLIGLPSELRSALNYTDDMQESIWEVQSSFTESREVIDSKLNDSAINEDYSNAQIQEVENLLSSITGHLSQLTSDVSLYCVFVKFALILYVFSRLYRRTAFTSYCHLSLIVPNVLSTQNRRFMLWWDFSHVDSCLERWILVPFSLSIHYRMSCATTQWERIWALCGNFKQCWWYLP